MAAGTRRSHRRRHGGSKPRGDAMADGYEGVPIWRRVVSAILDALTAFFVFGFLIAKFTGELTPEGGFSLKGSSALLLFGLIVAYFVIGRRFLGGTVWQYILRATRRRAGLP